MGALDKNRKKALKEKAASIKEQRSALKATGASIDREKLSVATRPMNTYVLEGDLTEHRVAPASSKGAGTTALMSHDDEEFDHVVEVEGRLDLTAQASEGKPAARVNEKVPWSHLKLSVLQSRDDVFAVDAARVVEEHDGNAADPEFTAFLKSVRGSVPVPSHWHLLSEFLSKQADRESASNIVPADIEATDVRELRASKDPKAYLTMNRIAFVRCFSVGTPLATKTFGVHLTKAGDVFEEGRWLPKQQLVPGVLSKALRDALGMKGSTAPPPWLHAQQKMMRLSPAYPFQRIQGLNAPIPEGAQWGGGEGMWGGAPRNENGSPTFPGVMGDIMGVGHTLKNGGWTPWGCIAANTASASATAEKTAPVVVPPTSTATTSSMAAPPPPPPPPKMPIAAPFMPTPYQVPLSAQQRAGPVREMEYTRNTDLVTAGLVAQGGVLLPRNNLAVGPAPPPPMPLPQYRQQPGYPYQQPQPPPPPPPPTTTKF